LEAFARDYVCASKRTALRRIQQDRIPHQKDHGHILIRQSVAEAWRDARTITPDIPTIKEMLKKIADDVLRKRKKATPSSP